MYYIKSITTSVHCTVSSHRGQGMIKGRMEERKDEREITQVNR